MLRWLPIRGDGPPKSLDVPLHQKMGSLFTQAPTGVEHEDTATDVILEPRLEPRDRLTFLEDELEGSREWKFRVEAETLPGETVCVTGDCRSLGGWASSRVLQLSQESSNVWSIVVAIPAKRDVQYRYAVCVIIQPDGHTITDTHIIVRHWETHTIPRLVTAKGQWLDCIQPALSSRTRDNPSLDNIPMFSVVKLGTILALLISLCSQ
uniref:CBM20 domain-containing protein n=1 Tax=Timema shepardi TaxID=629360 RepID=A0A7R9G776_TIMSH|nr:unnamed protein product [Timema shepardi]